MLHNPYTNSEISIGLPYIRPQFIRSIWIWSVLYGFKILILLWYLSYFPRINKDFIHSFIHDSNFIIARL